MNPSILPTLSSFPVPYTTSQHDQPRSQQQSIPDSLFSSYVHSTPTLALPHFHPLPLPSNTVLGVDFHTPEPMPSHHSWYSTMDPPTQVFRPDVQLPNMEPRNASAPAHELLRGMSINIDPASMARPTTRSRATTHPYSRLSFRKKTRPAADYTPNVESVQARCVADGGDPAAIRLLRSTFAGGISTNALTRRMTRDEAREHNHGAPGQMFRAFLRVDKEKRFRCRLCAIDADEGGWKQARDALRHLKRDHFGLGTRCDRCGRVAYTTGELTRHRCVVSTNL